MPLNPEAGEHRNPEAMGLLFAFLMISLLAHIFMYDRLNSLRNELRGHFWGLTVLLRERARLVYGILPQMEQTMGPGDPQLKEIAMLCAKALGMDLTPDRRMETDNLISYALSGLIPQVSAHRDSLGEEWEHILARLETLEEKMSTHRESYNQSVSQYNQTLKTLPFIPLARFFGFTPWVSLESFPMNQTPPPPDLKKEDL